MTATTAMVARLRRMVNEPTESTYTDTILRDQIEEYPLPDTTGLESGATGWVPTYDLNLAAAALWNEKAATLVSQYNFSADGASFSRGQAYENAVKMANHYAEQSQQAKKRRISTRKATSYKMKAEPVQPDAPGYDPRITWIGNLPEEP